LSERYSNSPSLHLTVDKSRLRFLLHCALSLCALYALVQVYCLGYVLLAFALLPLVASLLWRLRSETLPGMTLCWSRGVWTLRRAGQSKVIQISERSHCLPWAIYLAWREVPSGSGGSAWLFVDSVSRQRLRQLRVRLSLEARPIKKSWIGFKES
jgi:hypothetical protein